MALTRKQIMANYYIRNKKSIGEKSKSYRLANKEKVKTIQADWYKRNKEEVKEYRQLNKHTVNAKNAEYRARKFRATIPTTKDVKAKIDELYVIASDSTNSIPENLFEANFKFLEFISTPIILLKLKYSL